MATANENVIGFRSGSRKSYSTKVIPVGPRQGQWMSRVRFPPWSLQGVYDTPVSGAKCPSQPSGSSTGLSPKR
jgi:hypothetical protein